MLERPEFSKTAGKLSLGLHGKFQLWMVSPIQKKWWCSLIFQLAICGRKSKSSTPLRSYSTSPERQRSNERSGEYDDDSYGASHAWRWKKNFLQQHLLTLCLPQACCFLLSNNGCGTRFPRLFWCWRQELQLKRKINDLFDGKHVGAEVLFI